MVGAGGLESEPITLIKFEPPLNFDLPLNVTLIVIFPLIRVLAFGIDAKICLDDDDDDDDNDCIIYDEQIRI